MTYWMVMCQGLSIGKKLIAINVIKGARTNVYLASSDEVANVSGKFFDKSKSVKSSKVSYSDSNQHKLWSYSENIINNLSSTGRELFISAIKNDDLFSCTPTMLRYHGRDKKAH